MERIGIKGIFSIYVNTEMALIDTANDEVVYASFFDVPAKINKINADIQAKNKMQLRIEGVYRRELIYNFPAASDRKILTRIQHKKLKREQMIIASTKDNVFFYDMNMNTQKQLKAFFMIKHRLLIPDLFLEEILEKYSRNADVRGLINEGIGDNGIRAKIIRVDAVKTKFFRSDENWLTDINTSIDFIKENADEFRETLKRNVKSLYRINHHYNIQNFKVQPFEGQEVLWGAGMEVLKKDDFLYIAADMGLGKTISSLIINHETQTEHRKKKFYTTLVIAPTSTMRGKDGGWTKEIQDVMTKANGEVIPHKILTITSQEGYKGFMEETKKINFKNPDKNYFVIVSKEALKLSYSKIPQYNKRHIAEGEGIVKGMHRALCCPKCGSQLRDNNQHQLIEQDFAEIDYKTGNIKIKNRIERNKKCLAMVKKWDDKDKTYKDVVCGEELFALTVVAQKEKKEFYSVKESEFNRMFIERAIDKYREKGLTPTRKVSIADYMKAKKMLFDGVIIDEVHEGNKPDSLIGRAQAITLKHGVKKIVLSGTSNAGYASNMFNIIRATMPKKLKERGLINSITNFSKEYGIFETKICEVENTKNGKADKKITVKEREGISSTIFVDFLAENYIFFTYKDIRKVMQPLNESYIKIEPNEKTKAEVEEFAKKIELINVRELGMKKDSILKHMINHPVKDWDGLMEVKAPFGRESHWLQIPKFEEHEHFEVHPLRGVKRSEKDEKMLELIKSEIKEKRKVCIFTYFTGSGASYMKGQNVQDRVTQLLESEGYRVAKLTQDKFFLTGKKPIKTKIDERAVRLFEEQDNYDILITNPKIVNVGINLRFIPTYINYMPTYHVSEISQANRRGYRINTTVENRVFHLYYQETIEEEIIERFQTKRLESKAMEGVFDVNIESEKEDVLRTHSKTVSTLVDKLGKNITLS